MEPFWLILRLSWPVLEPSCDHFGASWSHPGPSWRYFGPSWLILGHLWVILTNSEHLELSWGQCEMKKFQETSVQICPWAGTAIFKDFGSQFTSYLYHSWCYFVWHFFGTSFWTSTSSRDPWKWGGYRALGLYIASNAPCVSGEGKAMCYAALWIGTTSGTAIAPCTGVKHGEGALHQDAENYRNLTFKDPHRLWHLSLHASINLGRHMKKLADRWSIDRPTFGYGHYFTLFNAMKAGVWMWANDTSVTMYTGDVQELLKQSFLLFHARESAPWSTLFFALRLASGVYASRPLFNLGCWCEVSLFCCRKWDMLVASYWQDSSAAVFLSAQSERLSFRQVGF